MDKAVLFVLAVVAVLQLVHLWLKYRERGFTEDAAIATRIETIGAGLDRLERGLGQDLSNARAEASQHSRELRGEVCLRMEQATTTLRDTLDGRLRGLDETERSAAQRLYEETRNGLKALSETLLGGLNQVSGAQERSFDSFRLSLGDLTKSNHERIEGVRSALDQGMTRLQESNEKRLDDMRKTVDEKLHGTLEKRLGESFNQVSERLEQVHRGLGEMQTLANGVGDLKRLMTNVKTRGTWGEMQLGNLLGQVLAPEQYAANVETRAGSGARVEFAIKLPGRTDIGNPVWLPIDAKFPQEDYQRLLDAQERADVDAAAIAGKALERAFRLAAKDISDRYLSPPATTDFAILFVPVEGLYAELLRHPGLVDAVQRDCRVAIAGPTTLAALLNSLQMGFRTLAIQKRSSEVWEVLGAVKTEFEKFGGVLEKAQKKIQEANSVMEQAKTRSRAMERKLRTVEELPSSDAQELLGLPDPGTAFDATSSRV